MIHDNILVINNYIIQFGKVMKDSGAGEIIYKGIEGMTDPMNHGAPSF